MDNSFHFKFSDQGIEVWPSKEKENEYIKTIRPEDQFQGIVADPDQNEYQQIDDCPIQRAFDGFHFALGSGYPGRQKRNYSRWDGGKQEKNIEQFPGVIRSDPG